MSNLLKILVLMFVLSVYAQTEGVSPNQKRVLELYAIAALLEICENKFVNDVCSKITTDLEALEPEIFFFQDAAKKEVLVIFSLNDYYPNVRLGYDKDANIKIIGRGVWFSDKQEYINEFLKSGDFIDETHAE